MNGVFMIGCRQNIYSTSLPTSCSAICDALLKYVYDFIISLVTRSRIYPEQHKHTRPSFILIGDGAARPKCDTFKHMNIYFRSFIEQKFGKTKTEAAHTNSANSRA